MNLLKFRITKIRVVQMIRAVQRRQAIRIGRATQTIRSIQMIPVLRKSNNSKQEYLN